MHDRPAALIAYLLSAAHGGKPRGLADFMPRFSEPSEADLVAHLHKD